MNPRHGTRTRPVPVWRLRRWLPVVLAGAAGLGGPVTHLTAQPPKADAGKPAEVPKADPKPADPAKAELEKTVSINFDKKPWDDVLDWYAKETGLILNTGVKPTGSVTIKPPGPPRRFTLGEATDYLNENMARQNFILVRYNTSFTIYPLEKDTPLDPTLLPRIDAADLPKRGKTEIVIATVGPLQTQSASDVVPEVEKMLTKFGKAILLERINAIQIVDTAGNILRIKKTLEENVSASNDTHSHKCEYVRARELANSLQTLLKDDTTKVEGAAAAASRRPGSRTSSAAGSAAARAAGSAAASPAAASPAAARAARTRTPAASGPPRAG